MSVTGWFCTVSRPETGSYDRPLSLPIIGNPLNLLGKAAKFTPEGRRIRVAGGSLEIVIRDTVIGILGSTTMPGHPPSSGVNIDVTPPRAAIRNAGETICSMRDQRR
jgi:hypothetical protein